MLLLAGVLQDKTINQLKTSLFSKVSDFIL